MINININKFNVLLNEMNVRMGQSYNNTFTTFSEAPLPRVATRGAEVAGSSSRAVRHLLHVALPRAAPPRLRGHALLCPGAPLPRLLRPRRPAQPTASFSTHRGRNDRARGEDVVTGVVRVSEVDLYLYRQKYICDRKSDSM